MQAKDLMNTEVSIVDTRMTCAEAAKIFLENKISAAPVVNNEGKLHGILSEKDIFRAMLPDNKAFIDAPTKYLDFDDLGETARRAGDKLVKEVMAYRLITAKVDTPVLKIGAQMVSSGIHQVPVVDEENKVIGMIKRGDIYRALIKEYFDL